MKFYWAEITWAAGVCIIGESFALGYNYLIRDLIKYIKFGDNTTWDGQMEGI